MVVLRPEAKDIEPSPVLYTLEEYTNKATNFANEVLRKGIKGKYIPGATPNTKRYVFNGKYIDMAWDGVEYILVSFEKR